MFDKLPITEEEYNKILEKAEFIRVFDYKDCIVICYIKKGE